MCCLCLWVVLLVLLSACAGVLCAYCCRLGLLLLGAFGVAAVVCVCVMLVSACVDVGCVGVVCVWCC